MSGDRRGPVEPDHEAYDDYSDEEEWTDEEYAAYEAQSASFRRAQSRRKKALITVGVLLLSLFFAFWWAWSYYKGSEHSGTKSAAKPSTTATCVKDGEGVVAPQKITVNVYNSTTRTGLAAGAAKTLGERGFRVATVSNDPAKKAVPGVAEVRFGPAGAGLADLVLKTLGEGATPVPDARPETTVDIALGEKFEAVGPLPKGQLPLCPTPSTVPSPSASS